MHYFCQPSRSSSCCFFDSFQIFTEADWGICRSFRELLPSGIYSSMVSGNLQNSRSFYSTEFKKFTSCFEIFAKGNYQITYRLGWYMFFKWVFASIFMLVSNQEVMGIIFIFVEKRIWIASSSGCWFCGIMALHILRPILEERSSNSCNSKGTDWTSLQRWNDLSVWRRIAFHRSRQFCFWRLKAT